MSVHTALDLYRTFQAKEPDFVTALDEAVTFPPAFGAIGKAQIIWYGSSKWRGDGAETWYEHTYTSPVDFCEPWRDGLRAIESPERPDALVLLGRCIAVQVECDGGEVRFPRLPKGTLLTATPDGRALVLVDEQRGVLGALLGGSQRITDRGIEG